MVRPGPSGYIIDGVLAFAATAPRVCKTRGASASLNQIFKMEILFS
jgi:hypothetical protein